MIYPLALADRFKTNRLHRQVQLTDTEKEAHMGMELVLVVLTVHIEGVQFTQLQGLQPGKVSNLTIVPSGVDHLLYIPAGFNFTGKEGHP